VASLCSHLVTRPSAPFILRRTTRSLRTEPTGQNRRNTHYRIRGSAHLSELCVAISTSARHETCVGFGRIALCRRHVDRTSTGFELHNDLVIAPWDSHQCPQSLIEEVLEQWWAGMFQIHIPMLKQLGDLQDLQLVASGDMLHQTRNLSKPESLERMRTMGTLHEDESPLDLECTHAICAVADHDADDGTDGAVRLQASYTVRAQGNDAENPKVIRG
jgi:hypothetical protein